MKSLLRRGSRWYAFVVSGVAVLAVWNSAAANLNLPGPKVVSKEVQQIIKQEPPVLLGYGDSVSFDPESSSVSSGSVKESCSASAEFQIRDIVPATEDSSPVHRIPEPLFVYPDKAMEFSQVEGNDAGGKTVRIMTEPAGTRPTVTLSFILENSISGSAPASVTKISISVEQLGKLDTSEHILDVFLSSRFTPPNAGIPILYLRGERPVTQDEIPLVVSSSDSFPTQREDFRFPFQLQPGEVVQIVATMDLETAGRFSLKPLVSGFRNGEAFSETAGEVRFGWARFSESEFANQSLHTYLEPDCLLTG